MIDFYKKYLQKNPIFYLLLCFLYLEILLRFAIFHNIQLSFIYIFVFDMSFAIFISLITRIMKRKVNIIIFHILLFIICLYYCIQILYYDFFKVFLTIYSIGNGGQVIEFYQDILLLVLHNFIWIILCFIPLFVSIIYMRQHFQMKRLNDKSIIIHVLSTFFFFCMGYSLMYIPTQELDSPMDIYQAREMNELTVNQFGMLTAARLDFQSYIFGKNENIVIEKPKEEEKPKEIIYQPQIININFEELSKSTDNQTLQAMDKYFQNVIPTYQNQYTGMFKDYNVILMTCEGFSPYAINKDVTPTLYKLSHEGFVFKNFYTPLWGVSTSDGEYVAMQGLIPKSGIWSFNASSNNYLPFTLGKQYEKLGYTTKAYHNHSYTYYGRDKSHPNLGYDYKGVGNGLKVTKQWPESDLEMMQQTVDEYIHEEHFHTYYMTVSGHTNYTFNGNRVASNNRSLVENLDYSNLTKGYLATQKELDKAMEYLLNRLHEENIADKTVIVMSADHYPYGLPKENYDELAGHKIDEYFELYKNSLIIWSAAMKEPIVVDKVGSSLDILPTISNLLGLKYDSRLLMGTDLLSKSDPLVIFSNHSFITDKVMYNSKTKKTVWLDGATEDTEYLKKMNKIVKQKFDYSQMILDNNYYSHVFKHNE